MGSFAAAACLSAAEPVNRPSKLPAETGLQKRKIPPKRRGQTDDATAWRFKFNRVAGGWSCGGPSAQIRLPNARDCRVMKAGLSKSTCLIQKSDTPPDYAARRVSTSSSDGWRTELLSELARADAMEITAGELFFESNSNSVAPLSADL